MTEARRNSYIFVSHAHRDRRLLRKTLRLLEQAGVAYWISDRDIAPSGNFGDEIYDAIIDAHSVLLVVTPNAVRAPYVGRELQLASKHEKRVIPYRLKPTELKGAFDLELVGRQWIDAADPQIGVAKLVEALGEAQFRFATETAVAAPAVWPKYAAAAAVVAVIGAAALGAIAWRAAGPAPWRWRDLPGLENPLNASGRDLLLKEGPEAGAASLGHVRPGTRVFLFADPKPLQSATDAGKLWLRYKEGDKWLYIDAEGLCAPNLPNPCRDASVPPGRHRPY